VLLAQRVPDRSPGDLPFGELVLDLVGACSPKRSSRMPRSASITLSRASWRVRPWLSAPGTSGTDATIQPSSPCSKTIVSFSDSLTP